MFQSLRSTRSLLMGLAILGVAVFHAPLWFPWWPVQLIHDSLYCGVDVFVFLSGLGACHSLRRRGAKGYLRQRAERLLPGLFPFLLLWSAVMTFLIPVMDFGEMLGSITLLGWWLGNDKQLNWYFSGIWLMYLLAPAVYRLFCRRKGTFGLWAVLVAVSIAFGLLWPFDHHRILLSRLPVFFTGMLFGRLEQREFQKEALLQKAAYAMILPGLLLIFLANRTGLYAYGERLGLWWYPFLLVIPGACILVARLDGALSSHALWNRLTNPLRLCGESSAEILMIHVGIFKLLQWVVSLNRKTWVLVLVGCVVLGCLYHACVVPRLSPSKTHKF